MVAVGDSAIFTVAVTGYAPFSYQWLKNGVAIAGANQPSYVTSAATSSDSGTSFTVKVSNSLGNITSSSAKLTVVPSSAPADVRFVAPNGSDSNPGTMAQPYLTIQHCAITVASGSTCEVRAGTYHEKVTPNSGITITAYNFEPVVVDGADPVTNWNVYQGSIYEASVPLRSDDTNQVFAGNEMMTEARWPNGNDLFHVKWATAQSGTSQTQIVDSNLPSINWVGAKIHLWSGSDPFGHETGVVTSSNGGQIGIQVGETGTCPVICPAKDGYYYLFGTLGALDAEKEWYYDPTSSTLYFMAPGNVNPNTIDVEAKQRDYAFDLRAKSGVTIRNISIFASTVVTDSSSANNTLDRLSAQYVSQFTDLSPTADDANGSAFSILQVHEGDSGIILNGTGNVLENSTISYSAGAGVAVEGQNNSVLNNLIENVDYVGDYASGIDLDGNNNTIQYNTIQSVGRQAIYVTAVTNQDVGYNNLFNAMMLSRDGGEIYACCTQDASGTEIHHNWIHDTQSLIKGAGDENPLSGVDIDNGSKGFEVDQNVLWNNQYFNVLINGVSGVGPINNDIVNNTVPDGSSTGSINVANVQNCTQTNISNNRVAVSVQMQKDGTACATSDNSVNSSGASDMTNGSEVGCNFQGCSSSRPPSFLSGGTIIPCTLGAP
jgi:hypothetical protein